MSIATTDANQGESSQPDPPTYFNELIRASAGTGKTFHLSNRYLRLVLNDVPVTEILATTFTRQAAREILDRILFRLATAAENDNAALELAMAIGLEDSLVKADESFREKCLRKLRELTSALPRLRVSTLDAFFAQIAQSFSLELGLPPGWRIVEESDEAAIRSLAIDRYLGTGKPDRVVKLMHLLSKGKAERSVSRMIAETVVELHGLYLDSEFKSWKRLSQIKPLDDSELQEAIMALNSCDIEQFDVVKAFSNAKQKDCEQAAAGQWDAFLSDGIAKNLAAGVHTFGRGKKNTVPDALEALYEPLISHAIALLRNQVAVQTESTYTLLDGFNTQYQDLKQATRSLRFDDINRSLLPFANAKAFQQIAFRMNGHINHLLLDEFQDTSLDQWRVIRPFAEHVANDDSRSFFCVGDVKQAIYGWRGGDADILDQMDKQLPNVTALELSDSYRSSSVVIDFVNRVNHGIANHPTLGADEQKAAQDWSDSFPQHATARKELAGYVTLETARIADGEDESQGDLVLDRCAERVADVISQCPTATVAVLTRSNDAVGKVIFRLQQKGIGASELGGNPLTDSAAVQIILSRLRIADHPGDSAAFFHLQNSPWANELGIADPNSGAFGLSEQTRRDLADYGYGTTIEAWANLLRPYCNPREWRRVQQLVELAFIYQQQTEQPAQFGFDSQRRIKSRTTEFINRIETQRVADPSTDQVSVMTVHKSKGLQFDVVFVVELDKGKPQTPKCLASRKSPFDPVDQVTRYVPSKILEKFPQNIQRLHHESAQTKFQETLCVLYVALTRPIHALHVIVAPSKPNAKTARLPKTSAGLIRAAIEESDNLPESSIVFELGDAKWSKDKNADATPASEQERSSAAKRRHSQIKLRPASNNLASGQSPSSREGGGRVRLTDRLSLDSSNAMLYGTVVHAWLEKIEWLDSFNPDDQAEPLKRIAQQLGFPPSQIEETWKRFLEITGKPEIRDLLVEPQFQTSLASVSRIDRNEIDRLVVRNEQPIAALIDDKVTSGFIDRLVVAVDHEGKPVAAQIIDYKTDTIDVHDDGAITSKAAFYKPQLEAYQAAVMDMMKLPMESVSCCLALLQPGCVVPVI